MLKRFLVLSLLFSIVAVAPALAQEYRGNLYVNVTTEDGSAIVGAKVTVSGIGATRTSETNDAGEARFIKLEPGTYTVEVSKDGFNTLINQGVEINTGANLTFPVALQRTEVVEEVVVTARTPLMDQRKTGSSTVLNPAEINQMPTSRDPWAVMSTIPGLQVDRINVGGNQSGQQSGFVGGGDDGDNASWVMDGVEFTDLAAQGASSTYFDWNSFQEIGFTTSGGDLEQPNPGQRLNFTTKQGTNRMSGSIGLVYTDADLQSAAPIFRDPDNDLVYGNEITEVFEKNFEFGGPIVPDKGWYWVGFSQNDVNVSLPGASADDPRLADRTELQNTTVKLNGNPGANTTLKGFYTEGDKRKIGRNAGPTRPQPTSWDQEGPSPIYTFDVSHFFTQDLEVSGQYSEVKGGFQLIPQGTSSQVRWDPNAIWQDTYLDYVTDRPTDIYAVRGNWFVDAGPTSHEIKFGFKMKEGEVQSFTGWGTQDVVAAEIFSSAWLYRKGSANAEMEYTSFWLGDTILFGNFTFNVGVLVMEQDGKQLPSTSAGNGLCPTCLPTVNFNGLDPGVKWDNELPRAGLTYTFDTARRQLVRANYGQYVDQFAFTDVAFNNPMNPAEIDLAWVDANGDKLAQFPELSSQFATPGVYDCAVDPLFVGNVDPCNPTEPVIIDEIDPDYEGPEVEEFTAGYEIELAKDFTLGVNYVNRVRDNTIWNPFADISTSAYDFIDGSFWIPSQTINDTVDCVGSGSCEIGIEGNQYTMNSYEMGPAAVLGPDGILGTADDMTNTSRPQLRTNRDGYEETFESWDITATKRLSNRWMFRGYFSIQDWEKDIDCNATGSTGECLSGPGIQSPANLVGDTTRDGSIVIASTGTSSGGFGNVFIGTSDWQYNLNGLVQLPKNFTVSANVNGREGYALPLFRRVDDFNNVDGIRERQNLQVLEVDSERLDDIHIVKLVQFGDTAVDLHFEVFNLFDDDTILQIQRRINSNAGRIFESLSPRIMRFGARVTFK
jgi:hypothetical protein